MRDHTIRLKIAQLRKAAGMKQGELARLVGITQVALSNYENCSSMPRIDVVVRIADVLGCTVDELVWRPDMTSVRLARMRETERRNDERLEAWREKHGQT